MKLTRRTALIIEDDFLTSDIIMDLLDDHDFENILIAENGTVALEILAVEDIDFITLDNQLPDIMGYELISEIRKVNTEADLIVVSSEIDRDLTHTMDKYNVFSYIHKGNLIDDLNQLFDSN